MPILFFEVVLSPAIYEGCLWKGLSSDL